MKVRSLIGAAAIACALSACSSGMTEVQQKQAQLLNPSVRIETKDTKGSGTVLHSSDRGTYIVTNFHVAGGATPKAKPVACQEENKTLDGALCKITAAAFEAARDAPRNMVQVRFWQLNGRGETVLSVLRDAEVIASDATRDFSLLRLEDSEFRAEAVAKLAPDGVRLQPTEDVFVCGAALGKRVYCTAGELSLVKDTLEGREHILTSAPTINGNSGGGLWHKRGTSYEYIGTMRAIDQVGWGSPITTSAYAIPNASLREFLAEAKLGDLI